MRGCDPLPVGSGALRLGPALGALRRRRGPVWLGSLGSTAPFGTHWGYDRGTPVDRWYIERFLAEHRADITGRVLEVKDSGYTERFGHALTERAVLDVDPANPRATHVADLAAGDGLPSERVRLLRADADAAVRLRHARRARARAPHPAPRRRPAR